MQALVKTPHTDIRIQGEIPACVLDALKAEYGEELKVYDGDEKLVDIVETGWYRSLKVTPGDAMRGYRENAGMTQSQIGEKLGGVPRQAVSGMERGTRPISVATARKLAAIFSVSASRFLAP